MPRTEQIESLKSRIARLELVAQVRKPNVLQIAFLDSLKAELAALREGAAQ